MAAQRSKKSRSLGIDPVQPVSSTTNTTTSTTSDTSHLKRPDLGDRNYSAPSVAQQKGITANRLSQNSKVSDRTNRSSKASSRNDPPSRGGGNAPDLQNSERQNRSARSSKRASNQEDIPLLNFVVVGNEGVGKTAFIRNALDLHKHKTISAISASKVSLGGKIYRVQLIELLLEDIECGPDQLVTWPRQISNLTFPNINGAFCLFDVTQKTSLVGLQKTISALSASRISSALISCKIDVSDVDQETAQAFSEQAQKTFERLIVGQTTVESPESAKRCLLRVLKAVLAEPDSKPSAKTQNLKTGSRTPADNYSEQKSRSPSASRSRSRSERETSRSKSREQLASHTAVLASKPEEDEKLKTSQYETLPPMSLKLNTQSTNQPVRRETDPQTPVSGVEPCASRLATPAAQKRSKVPETPESCAGYTMLRPGTADTDQSRTQHTFLNMDDDSIHSNTSDSEAAQIGSLEKLSLQNTKSEGGVTFPDLVSRLLSHPTTRSDEKFIPSFLCLYRCFATPHRLLTEIADHFVKVENDSTMVSFSKVAEQLRYLSVLSLWTEDYPGDFATSAVRDVIFTFVKSIEKSKHFGPAAKEISNNLQVYVTDEDEDWTYSDTLPNRSRSATLAQKRPSNEALSRTVSKPTQDVDSENGDSEDDATRTQSSLRHSGAPSSTSSLLKTGNPPTKTATNLLALESARENARRLRCVPHLRVGKVQWHLFMDSPIEDLAREIIRIDWTLYSAIRPRDFVRQATCAGAQKAKNPVFDTIAAMTKHFNHLTFFVSGMILLRDKPKHRARILEKFMHLAWKVRQQNDYQSLGAIVAALKGEEIIRLGQTHEIIPQETLKQFWRLRILMDHQRSHSAYRMAWENSFNERIPFLPRVQEDLTKAAAGNPTFIGQNIKWSKFEVMGETIIGLQKSREAPYTFPEKSQRSQELARLILETKVLDGPEDCDDPRYELYERSKQIEPQTATESKKKFDWLRR